MHFELGQKDPRGSELPPILVVTEAEAQQMCDDPHCDKVRLNMALLRCRFAEGWEVRGGAKTLRNVGLTEWAELADKALAKAQAAPPASAEAPAAPATPAAAPPTISPAAQTPVEAAPAPPTAPPPEPQPTAAAPPASPTVAPQAASVPLSAVETPTETVVTPAAATKAPKTPKTPKVTPPVPAPIHTSQTAYSDAVARLRVAQGQLVVDADATPRQLMLEALQPIQQFGDSLRAAGVIKWAGTRTDIGFPNCTFETVGPGVNYEGYPVVFVYCVSARPRGNKGKISWQIRVWSESFNKRSRKFTERDGYEKVFRFVTDCLERM